MPFFGTKKGGNADGAEAAAGAGSSVPGNSDTSAHSSQPILVRDSSAVGGSVMNVESSLSSSRRPPRSLVIDRVSQAGAGLARASVDLARDLAREFVEPPVQTSTLIHRHLSGRKSSAVGGDELGAAKAAAADLESVPSGDGEEDGSHTKQHGRHGLARKPLTPLELESMPKGTCEDGVRRRGNTFRCGGLLVFCFFFSHSRERPRRPRAPRPSDAHSFFRILFSPLSF